MASDFEGERRDLQRQYEDRLSQLNASYEGRLAHLSSSLLRALEQIDGDGALATLQRDPVSRNHVLTRLDELMKQALQDERERALRDALRALSEERCTVAQLERKLTLLSRQNDMSSFESAHRSSLSLGSNSQQMSRLEAALRDARRELSESRSIEVVLREQLDVASQRDKNLQNQTEAVRKEKDDLRLKLANQEEQLLLAREHAKEANLAAELSEKRSRTKLASKENEMKTEVSRLTAELAELKQKQQATLIQEIGHVKLSSSHETLIALNEQRAEAAAILKRTEDTWRERLEIIEAEMRALEKSSAEELAQNQALYSQERQTLVDSNRAHIEATYKQQQAHITDLNQTHALEVGQLQERVQQLLQVQHKLAEEKDKAVEILVGQKVELEKKAEANVKSLQETVSTLQNQLSTTTAVKAHMDKTGHIQQEEWKLLTQRYNDVVVKYQALSAQATAATAALQQVTHERDNLKEKYAALGEKLENLIGNVEQGMASTVEQEKNKREALKQHYVEERKGWKGEKVALMETVSLQERKILDLQSVVASFDEKTNEMRRFQESLKAQAEKAAHEAALTIQQLQQDILTLQAHRKTVEKELQEKIHHIEKLMIEKTHANDYSVSANNNANMAKDSSIATIEAEFNLRSVNNKFELEQAKKELDMKMHKQNMDFEMEKQNLWKEAQNQMDTKLDELRRNMFSPEQFEAAVKLKVEERVNAINKTLLYPHQHEAMLSAKLDALKAKLTLDHSMTIQEMQSKHSQYVQSLEHKHALKQDELKLKYEGEYELFTQGMKSNLSDAEQRLKTEKKSLTDLQKQLNQSQQDMLKKEGEVREQTVRIEGFQANEARFLSHISSQSSVIEKLKSMLEVEKKRVLEMPIIERKKYSEQFEEEQKRFALERSNLQRNQQEQLLGLQNLLDTEKKLLAELQRRFETREQESREREEALHQQHRTMLDSVHARHAELVANLETQQKQLWIQREGAWKKEQEARENFVQQKLTSWEESYKNELSVREVKLKSLHEECRALRERNEQLEQQVQQLQKQLRDSVSVLEAQTEKMNRVGSAIRIQEALQNTL